MTAVDGAMRVGAIVAAGVGKWYPPRDRGPTLGELLYRRFIRASAPPAAVWSLRDVSVDVAPGESLGIVGHNGAGKSTLLKIIAGIARPSAGRVAVAGRSATQLALGAGFNPYLTGRGNLFLQGTLLGLTNREVTELQASMVAFAELEAAIDRPLWTYSSGMVARLGFAVAVHARFDVLLLDEALSAGDASFRERCAATLTGFRKAGKTLVIVSHGAESIRRFCDRALWLERGHVHDLGAANTVVAAYETAMRRRSQESR